MYPQANAKANVKPLLQIKMTNMGFDACNRDHEIPGLHCQRPQTCVPLNSYPASIQIVLFVSRDLFWPIVTLSPLEITE